MVYKKFITPHLKDPPSQPVKIAVLDTGIDRDHVFFDAREGQLKGRRNFYNEAQKNVPDTHGHGTFTASLLLDYAPNANLYVIKIADKENTRPDAKIVAKVRSIGAVSDCYNAYTDARRPSTTLSINGM